MKSIFSSFAFATGMFTATLSTVMESEETANELEANGFNKEKQAQLHSLLLELAQTFYTKRNT